MRNRSMKSHLRSRIKRVIAALDEKDFDQASATLRDAIPVIDKAAAKGIIHPANASRKISRLACRVNALKAKE